MSNTIILVVLFIISIVFLIAIRKKGNKSETLSFISTLIATLVGVLLAVSLSNLENKKKETADTIKLLNTAKNILDGTYNYSNTLSTYIIELEKDSSYTISRMDDVKLNNPIPYPDLMETIISNELISKNISEFSHNQVYNGLINMKKVCNYNSIKIYKKLLKEQILLLDLEINYQKGELSIDDLSEKFDSGRETIAKTYPIEEIIELTDN